MLKSGYKLYLISPNVNGTTAFLYMPYNIFPVWPALLLQSTVAVRCQGKFLTSRLLALAHLGCDTFFKRILRTRKVPMDEQRPQQGQVQIKADEKELQGSYSNLVMIHHNLEEFTLNFIYIFPNGAQGKLLQSMIVSPGHAKRIWRALGENISRYEAQFGQIKEMPDAGPTPNVGFVQ